MKKYCCLVISMVMLITMVMSALPALAATVGGTYDATGYLVRDLYSNGTKNYNFHSMSGGAYVSYSETTSDRLSP